MYQVADNEDVFSGRPTKNFSFACQKNFPLNASNFFS